MPSNCVLHTRDLSKTNQDGDIQLELSSPPEPAERPITPALQPATTTPALEHPLHFTKSVNPKLKRKRKAKTEETKCTESKPLSSWGTYIVTTTVVESTEPHATDSNRTEAPNTLQRPDSNICSENRHNTFQASVSAQTPSHASNQDFSTTEQNHPNGERQVLTAAEYYQYVPTLN